MAAATTSCNPEGQTISSDIRAAAAAAEILPAHPSQHCTHKHLQQRYFILFCNQIFYCTTFHTTKQNWMITMYKLIIIAI